MESPSVKGAMGGGGSLFEETLDLVALLRPGATCSTIFKI